MCYYLFDSNVCCSCQVNPHTHQLKLCDFGSAKVLVRYWFKCTVGWWKLLFFVLEFHPHSSNTSGKRRTKCFLHLFKILPCSGTYIWGHRIYNCHRHMVNWLCNGWITSWTGNAVFEKMSLYFSHFIIYPISLCFPWSSIWFAALVSWGEWSWSASWNHQGKDLPMVFN